MRVTYKGYRRYVRQLQADAGLIDPELEELVERYLDEERKIEKLGRTMGRFMGRVDS